MIMDLRKFKPMQEENKRLRSEVERLQGEKKELRESLEAITIAADWMIQGLEDKAVGKVAWTNLVNNNKELLERLKQ